MSLLEQTPVNAEPAQLFAFLLVSRAGTDGTACDLKEA